MAVISLVSCSGGPGVTTTAVGLAAAGLSLIEPEPVLVELASSGGVVASWHDLPTDPGLTSLAVASTEVDANIFQHAQELPGGLAAVLAPPSGVRTSEILRARAGALARYLQRNDRATVVVDGGRVTLDHAIMPVLRASSIVGVVARPKREELRLAAEVAMALAAGEAGVGAASPAPEVGWILIGDSPWKDDEIFDHYRIPVLGHLPHDPSSADALAGRRRLRRHSPLARAARSLAERVLPSSKQSPQNGSPAASAEPTSAFEPVAAGEYAATSAGATEATGQSEDEYRTAMSSGTPLAFPTPSEAAPISPPGPDRLDTLVAPSQWHEDLNGSGQ